MKQKIELDQIAGRNKYQEMDDKGRLKFQGFCIAQPWCTFNRKSKDEMAHWDVSYFSGTTRIIGEIKDRRCTSNAYETLLLQVNKLQELQKLQKAQPDSRIHYINFFTDNEIEIIDITDIDITITNVEEVLLPKTFVEDTDEINKAVIYLPRNNKLI